jgi:Kef-type K+ transport system membrane component KefB
MSTIMGVAAFDDAIGIILYSIAITFASSFISPEHVGFSSVAPDILGKIVGAMAVGAAVGFIFNKFAEFVRIETEGLFIVLIIGLLAVCFGISALLGIGELLAAMFMGFIVVNFNKQSDLIFRSLERYTEQLIFVLFFTISGMHLNIAVLADYSLLVLFFVLLRAVGKYTGTRIGAGKVLLR